MEVAASMHRSGLCAQQVSAMRFATRIIVTELHLIVVTHLVYVTTGRVRSNKSLGVRILVMGVFMTRMVKVQSAAVVPARQRALLRQWTCMKSAIAAAVATMFWGTNAIVLSVLHALLVMVLAEIIKCVQEMLMLQLTIVLATQARTANVKIMIVHP